MNITISIEDNLFKQAHYAAKSMNKTVEQLIYEYIKRFENASNIKLEPNDEQMFTDSCPREPGLLKGKIKIADNFDDPLPESIMYAFMGDL
ncbi:MAG: type II toxin-antitoxin system prevent-host-death family antitoxin [Desulfamplus sp.]|nr:type II toxin-antitoxin system prevent-host-death family antitoxin [Desulfamplus sp.]